MVLLWPCVWPWWILYREVVFELRTRRVCWSRYSCRLISLMWESTLCFCTWWTSRGLQRWFQSGRLSWGPQRTAGSVYTQCQMPFQWGNGKSFAKSLFTFRNSSFSLVIQNDQTEISDTLSVGETWLFSWMFSFVLNSESTFWSFCCRDGSKQEINLPILNFPALFCSLLFICLL